MRAPHRIVQLTVAAVVLVLGGVAAPAHADGYIENGTDNPVAARPAPTRPTSKHCTVTLADHFLSNGPDGAPRNFQGTVTPPAACPGPWAKVLMDYDVSVGRSAVRPECEHHDRRCGRLRRHHPGAERRRPDQLSGHQGPDPLLGPAAQAPAVRRGHRQLHGRHLHRQLRPERHAHLLPGGQAQPRARRTRQGRGGPAGRPDAGLVHRVRAAVRPAAQPDRRLARGHPQGERVRRAVVQHRPRRDGSQLPG